MIVRRIDDDSCLLFTPGQSALEGFLVSEPWDRVVGDLNEEIERSIDEAYGEEGSADDSEGDDDDALPHDSD
jgi:hypothetical protein